MHIKLYGRTRQDSLERYFLVRTRGGELYISDSGACEECLREMVGRYPDAMVTMFDGKGKILKKELSLFQLLQQEDIFIKRPPMERAGGFAIVRPRWGSDSVMVYKPKPEDEAATSDVALSDEQGAA